MWCDQVELSSYLTKSPKKFLNQGTVVFIDSDNHGETVETLSPRFHWWPLRSVPKQSRLWIPQDNPCSRKVVLFMRCSLKQQTKGLTELCPVQTSPFQMSPSKTSASPHCRSIQHRPNIISDLFHCPNLHPRRRAPPAVVREISTRSSQ